MLILPRCIFGCKKKNHPNQTPPVNSCFWFPYNHPIGKDYKWYISGYFSCQLGDYIYHRSHLSREPRSFSIDPGLLPTNSSTSQAVKGGAFNPITGEAIGDRGLDAMVAMGDRVNQPGTSPGRVGRPPPGADSVRVGWLRVGWLVGRSFFGFVVGR